jgi:hypothetical protein
MNGVRPTASSLRQAISLALILLFGPAPLVSLLARADEPQCQMACCKRKGFARSCALHHSAASESSTPGLQASVDCPPGCTPPAGAPSAFSAGFVTPLVRLTLHTLDHPILTASTDTVQRMVDSFLHQRPPPRSFA